MTIRLMIVEDDLELHELYMHMLDETGWQVDQVHDGTEAWARLQRGAPDVLILDIMLDEMGGDELYAKVRRHPVLARLPVIVISVLSAERCNSLIHMDDATFFLRKPFHRQALLVAVRDALENRGE